MKQALLATVAVAALAIGGMAHAQQPSSAQPSPSASSPGEMKSGADKEKAAPPRAAQSEKASPPRSAQGEANRAEPSRGAAQAGPETGPQRAQERRAEPNRTTGASEQKPDATKSQAQRDKQPDSKAAPTNRTGAAEGDRSRTQAQENRSAPPANRTGAAANEQTKGTAAPQRSGTNETSGAAQQPNRSSTAASPNSGGDVNVTGSIRVDTQKASRVHDELIRTAPKENINISISVGERVPDRVRVRKVPASIISISPEFRGYDYVVVRDEIIIVEPKTKKVVTVIQSRGGASKAQRASFSLNAQQKSRIRSDIRMESARNFDVEVREGRVVPQTVVLEPLPDVIIREVPQVRDYRYFVDDRRVIIVDPATREVVDIID